MAKYSINNTVLLDALFRDRVRAERCSNYGLSALCAEVQYKETLLIYITLLNNRYYQFSKLI